MPIRTTITNWESRRPDYWAGERGGRPVPTGAPRPKYGDGLPREDAHTLSKTFATHDEAVAYAKLFNKHCQIRTITRFDDDLSITKSFLVMPAKGKVIVERNLLGIVTKITYTKLA